MKNTTAVLIGGIVACFVVVVVACTLVTLFSDRDVATFITPVLGFTGTTLALLATLARVGAVDAKVDSVTESVDYLANGGTDAKIRAGIADVVKEDFIKDDVGEQLDADRATRAAGAGPASSSN